MKIQIDTNQKTIKVLETVNLKDLVKALKVILGDEYDNYTLETGGYVYSWVNPIYIPYYSTYLPYYPTYPNPYPTYPPTWTLTTGTTQSIYNVELQAVN